MNIHKQKGLTLIGFGMVLVIALFVAYTGMKVIPMYLEYHALVNALKTVQNDPLAKDQSAAKIRKRILNSLWVSYASNNIKADHIKIKRSNGIHIRVVYEVRKTWISNIDLIAHFDKSVTLRK